MSDSVQPHRQQPTRLPRPWDSPGKNTGVGCHFILQCTKVKCESEVAQSCPTPSDPMDCSPPGSSVHGIFQARVLEWGAIAFSDALSTGILILCVLDHLILFYRSVKCCFFVCLFFYLNLPPSLHAPFNLDNFYCLFFMFSEVLFYYVL